MSETRYRIVFDGKLLNGVEPTTAKLNLAQLFKSDLAAVEDLFNGTPVALKRDLSHVDALSYLDALHKTGIDPRIEAQEPEVEAPIVPAAALPLATAPAPVADPVPPYAPPQPSIAPRTGKYDELKVFTVQGRIGRLRYLAWTMAALLVGVLPLLITSFLFSTDRLIVGTLFGLLVLIPYAFANIAISVKRLHDLGWSGWLWLLNFVPVVGSFFPLVIAVLPGNEGDNRYGPPPPPNTTSVKVLCLLWLVLLALFILVAVTGILATLLTL